MKMKLPLPKPPIKQQVNQKNIAQLNQKLNQLSSQFKAATSQGNYQEAHKAVSQVLKLVPNHVIAYMDLAFTELRLGRYHDAYQHYQKAIQLSPNNIDTNIYDGLAEVCHFLDKTDELKKYGRLAVESKKQLVADQRVLTTISTLPSAFNPNNPEENKIVFSLFGGNPRYCETSVINVDLIHDIYPEWTCRFYIDETVPENVVSRLKQKGAEVIYVDDEQKKISGLFWRFFVMDDPTVKRFLIRDADSLVSYREKAAVDEWLNSDKWFHTMHDYYSHTELILAGMWGGCHGVFVQLQQLIQKFMSSGTYLTSRVADQHFLRFCIWPTLSQSVLMHDSQQFDPLSVDFPQIEQFKAYEQNPQFHVGMNEGSSQIVIQVSETASPQVFWTIFDEHDQQVCRYQADVPPSKILELDLPQHYASKIKDQVWKVLVNSVENIH